MNRGAEFLIFDEGMQERPLPYRYMEALARFGPSLNDSSVDKVIKTALEILTEIGFPGAMLSLILPDQEGDYIIAQNARGGRFERVLEMTRHPLSGENILVLAVRENRSQFIADSRQHPDCYPETVAVGQLISQYVLPLRRLDGALFGILQVDLGDLSHKTQEEFIKTDEAKILNSLAEMFRAVLDRVIKSREQEILLKLEQALEQSLSASSVEEGLQRFIYEAGQAFGVMAAHVRLVTQKDAGADYPKAPALTLAAGFGPLYEAGRRIRRVVSRKDASLIYKAFSNDMYISNDLTDDNDYQAVCQAVADNVELAAAYEHIKSYAAIAFKNKSGRVIGALSLASTKSWFFKAYHQRTIESLAQRVAFLVEHLRDNNRLQFLFDITTNLAEIDLDKIPLELENALGRFCEAIKAELSSLYLWDEGKEKFVLRAQYGWKEPEWVNAAGFNKGDNWIGIQAFKAKPKYFPDIYKHYQEEYAPNPNISGGHYSKHMFGSVFSESFTFEAIGLPLKVGKKEKRFGILTLYRRIEPGEPSGFLITDEKLLEEGAYKMAGLVKALLEHLKDVWRHIEQARHQRVYEAIASMIEIRDDFAAEICQEILKIYEAVRVDFYKVDDGERAAISWAAGYGRVAGAEKLEKIGMVEPDKFVRKAVSNALNEKKRGGDKIALQRHKIRKVDRGNPKLLAKDGLVERVCIPMLSSQQLVGVLDLRWQVTHQDADLLKVQPELLDLGRLGHIIGEAYVRHQLAEEAERSNLAVQATGAYVFQRAHRLMNGIQTLYYVAQAIKSAKPEDRESKIEKLEKKAAQYIEMIDWTIDLGERVQMPVRERLVVYDLIRKSVDETDEQTRDSTGAIHINVPPDLIVMAAYYLLKEIFVNLIDNAFEAMKAEKQPLLKISASLCKDGKEVEIIFEDKGVGMTKEELKNAERGFVANGSHKGVGVLISKVLAQAQGGSLRYESGKGRGTKAIVTLQMG